MKKILKVLGCLLILFVFVAGTLLAYLTIDEYNPADIEQVEVEGEGKKEVATGEEYTFITWNIGYGALGDNADFFMDGGKSVYSATKERVNENLAGIAAQLDEINPDFALMQELDRNSSRSYYIDELETIRDSSVAKAVNGQYTFAPNFNVAYVPLPVPPIGRVVAGVTTYSAFKIDSAQRKQLPCPFTWPLRTINLKRCLLISRLPVNGSDKELVLINLHLEAYDDGEGKIAQTNMLKEIMQEEADKGNYLIVAGDFNQTFSNVDASKYPVIEGKWQPGSIDISEYDSYFSFYADASHPTGRSLDQALTTAASIDPKDFQYYMLDGFIVSGNVEVSSVETVDAKFKYSDHNPVMMKFSLKTE